MKLSTTKKNLFVLSLCIFLISCASNVFSKESLNSESSIVLVADAWEALKNVEGRDSKLERFLSRAERIAKDFMPSDDCKE